jgi:hypothetical protein
MHKAQKISKEKLSELYQSMKSQDLCLKLKISQPTLVKLIKKAGIQLKGKGNRWPRLKYEVV